MRELTRRISFGMGVPAQERTTDHPVLDGIREAEFEPQRKLAQAAAAQLGTVGSGNHYVNVMEDETGRIRVGVHFGSPGFGHKTASGFLALAQGLEFGTQAQDGEMGSPPVLFEIDSELGQAYISAMQLAGDDACAGRDIEVEGPCPDHPDAGVMKRWVDEQVKPGLVDWPAVQGRLIEQGIVLVGGGADEAPQAYKRLPEVLAAHAGSVRVKHTLRPLGVAMAGRDVHDPYKD